MNIVLGKIVNIDREVEFVGDEVQEYWKRTAVIDVYGRISSIIFTSQKKEDLLGYQVGQIVEV